MNLDDLLLAIIIAGIGLSIGYLRAEFVLRRERKVKERKKAIVQREWHANRLRLQEIGEQIAASGNHQLFLSKKSAICAPAESPSTVYSRKSTDIGSARHRELT